MNCEQAASKLEKRKRTIPKTCCNKKGKEKKYRQGEIIVCGRV